jgi:hypothetical protein
MHSQIVLKYLFEPILFVFDVAYFTCTLARPNPTHRTNPVGTSGPSNAFFRGRLRLRSFPMPSTGANLNSTTSRQPSDQERCSATWFKVPKRLFSFSFSTTADLLLNWRIDIILIVRRQHYDNALIKSGLTRRLWRVKVHMIVKCLLNCIASFTFFVRCQCKVIVEGGQPY